MGDLKGRMGFFISVFAEVYFIEHFFNSRQADRMVNRREIDALVIS